ncbi:MAG: HDOD domain-containing protein [Lentisphaeraceae bacterium]|nr:HDOD domain-containing protein [Lentisphaeraceae bacterium]
MNEKARLFLLKCQMPGAHPLVYDKVQKLIADANVPRSQLMHILTMDPCIAAAILRHKSSAYNQNKTVYGNLSKAVTGLGLAQIRAIIGSIKPQAAIKKSPIIKTTFDDLWRRSLAVATAAKLIDQTLGGNSQEIFTAGLLHDFGRIIMILNHEHIALSGLFMYCRSNKQLLYKHERRTLGFNHMELADAIFEQWNMPGLIRETATYHHTPLLAIRYQYESTVVHVADIICSAIELGGNGDKYVPALDEKTVNTLGLSNDQLDILCEETDLQLQQHLKVFSL